MADGYVQVLPDSTGKKVDTTELVRGDGTLVERQRIDVVASAYDVVNRQLNELAQLQAQDGARMAQSSRGRERIALLSFGRGGR